ncbi:MAG: hypothetical protein AAFR02_11195, partial [Pseudomonadota bacterium]
LGPFAVRVVRHGHATPPAFPPPLGVRRARIDQGRPERRRRRPQRKRQGWLVVVVIVIFDRLRLSRQQERRIVVLRKVIITRDFPTPCRAISPTKSWVK